MNFDNNARNAVIYARYSSTGQRDESIEGQLRDCHAFAKANGLTVAGEYCDKALTGTNDRRPEFQRMIADAASHAFQFLIVWKADRFARSRYDSAVYKYKLKQQGVKILYARESIPEGPEGIILEALMEGMAEYYSANLSQNVKRGNYDSALKRQTLGQMVYGLRTGANKRFELDPVTAPVVKRIFDEYAAGIPAVDICAGLNADGFRTMRGNLFNKSSIRRIVQNEKYVGVYTYADIRDENGIPAIVDRDTFDRVQKMVERHHRAPSAKHADEEGFLLTGKLFCGLCGRPMIGDSGKSKNGSIYHYYTCTGRRSKRCTKDRAQKRWIEDLVVSALAQVVCDDSVVDLIADRFMTWQESQREASQLDSLTAQLAEVERAIKNNMALVDSGLITDEIKDHLRDLGDRRKELNAAIAEEKLKGSAPMIERDAIVWFLRSFRTGDQTDQRWRVYIVDTFLAAAYLYDDGRLNLRLNFSGEESEISLKTAEQAVEDGEILCSALAPSGLPFGAKTNTMTHYFGGVFIVSVFAK